MFSLKNNLLPSNLLPDEQIIYSTKKHWIIFFVPVVLTIATFFFLINKNEYVFKLSFAPAIAAGLTWINQYLMYITSHFTLTTKRLIMKEGFFFRHSNDTRLSAVANVSVDQSLLGQLLGYGTVVIYPFGGAADPFIQIANPNEFQKQLQVQWDKIAK